MLDSARTLLSGLIDYAGLFPPAMLPMRESSANFAAILAGSHSWMLGRLIIPASRLDEFEKESSALWRTPGDTGAPDAPETWRISAVLGDDPDRDIDRIFAFNQAHAPDEPGDDSDVASAADADGRAAPGVRALGGAVIDTVELKVSAARDIDRLLSIIPEQLGAFFEIPIGDDPRGMITALAGSGAAAKLRTGGVTPDAFPAPVHVARFLSACHAADVAFKATAGLHHALRGEYPLTYEPGCPCATMYGLLNIFVAAAGVRTGEIGERDAAELLQERDPSAIRVVEQGVAWRAARIPTPKLAMVRESFALSYGSCSFDEPVAELRALGLID